MTGRQSVAPPCCGQARPTQFPIALGAETFHAAKGLM
jgi:hypothetical protein